MANREQDLAARVVGWLQQDGWDVWQELQDRYSGPVLDICARRGPATHAIECKMEASFAVLEQAMEWRGRANFVSVAVPVRTLRASASTVRSRRMFGRCCEAFGLGLIEVSIDEDWRQIRWGVGQMARVREDRFFCPLAELLTDERRAWPAAAGNNRSERYTPFREFCARVRVVVEAEPGITVRAAVERAGEHHYSSDKAARSSILHWIVSGKVHGVRAKPGSRCMQLFPSSAEAKA